MLAALQKERTVHGVRARSWEHLGARGLPGIDASHAPLEICWVSKGSLTYRIEGKTDELALGQMFVVGPGVPHRTSASASVRACSFWFDRQLIDDLASTAFRDASLATGAITPAEQLRALGALLHSDVLDGAQDSLAVDVLAEAFLLRFVSGVRRRVLPGRTPAVRRAVDFIHATFAKDIGLQEISHQAGLSRFELSRRFRYEVGSSPYQYLIEVRIAEAARRLARGTGSVTEAAMDVGFRDMSRFARMFTARHGVSPSAYQRRPQASKLLLSAPMADVR